MQIGWILISGERHWFCPWQRVSFFCSKSPTNMKHTLKRKLNKVQGYIKTSILPRRSSTLTTSFTSKTGILVSDWNPFLIVLCPTVMSPGKYYWHWIRTSVCLKVDLYRRNRSKVASLADFDAILFHGRDMDKPVLKVFLYFPFLLWNVNYVWDQKKKNNRFPTKWGEGKNSYMSSSFWSLLSMTGWTTATTGLIPAYARAPF